MSLRSHIKNIPDVEQLIGRVVRVVSGNITILTNSGKRITAISHINELLTIGDFVVIVLTTPPSVIGKTSFTRESGTTFFI